MRPPALPHRFLPSARLAGALVLAATLGACASGVSLDEPIEGPTWRLVQLGEQPLSPAPEAARQPQVRFDNADRIAGTGGCNRFSGAFLRNGSQMRMSQLAATRMACPEPYGAREMQFFQALQTTASYRLAGPGRLVLLDAGGRTLAHLDSTGR